MLNPVFLIILFAVLIPSSLSSNTVQLHWIGDNPAIPAGVSWGVPFEKGKIKAKQAFELQNNSGLSIGLQNWPLAYWPDGSVKWMGFAASALQKGNYYRMQPVAESKIANPFSIKKTVDGTCITYGKFSILIDNNGESIIKYIKSGDKTLINGGNLIAQVREGKQDETGSKLISYKGKIEEIITEQQGPVRAVICLKGKYVSAEKQLFPFTLRMYCYQDVEYIRLVHSFVYDGDQDRDFIDGIGLKLNVPFRESLHNRHVFFSGEKGGIWKEPVKPLVTRSQLRLKKFGDMLQLQKVGKRIAEVEKADTPLVDWYPHLPEWDNYKLTQLHPGGFTIQKQTQSRSSWLQVTTGGKSNGLVFVGDVTGGVGLSLRDFWQSYPASMEITGARTPEAALKMWFWSPDAPDMDLRHYDTIAHDLDVTYEDVQKGLSTPYGIARTSEMTLFLTDTIPSNQLMSKMAQYGSENAFLTCSPEYLHQQKAFGSWSLPNRSTTLDNHIENQLDSALKFYQQAIAEHQWYGFWNYGDVMHSYDASRNSWKYDLGGYAWANTELAPNNWLWYSFLRTGRADVFKMAEAMTRHTGEVDAYHLGEMKGLGTRHNVSHWGCGAKEARIGQAAWKRFYYYLTTDERCGDLMTESLDAEQSMMRFEPLRIAQPKEKFPYGGPTRLRWGPDWLALAGNWMTEWERTGNTHYRDKIITGLDCLSKLPNNLFTGSGGLSYDPTNGKIWYDGKAGLTNKNHLASIMGGYEILMEMMEMIPHKAFRKTFTAYAKLYSMPDDDPERDESNRELGGVGFRNPRLTAFAARELQDEKTAQRAWMEFLFRKGDHADNLNNWFGSQLVSPPEVIQPIHENPGIGTNGTSQWGLNAIIMKEMIGNYIPDTSQISINKRFKTLNEYKNTLIFQDEFRKGISKNWFTDGKKAKFNSGKSGLIYQAGPMPANEDDHAVLWTKKSFSENIKIEFEFTRLDDVTKFVNIIYLFAEGSGKESYDKDISLWKNLREIPAMKTYFNHMNLFHLSFAAFENNNEDMHADYIRARKYQPETNQGLTGTEIMPEFLRTGFFQTGVKHHITIIRHKDEIFMEVKNAWQTKLYHWKSDNIASLHSGRIGLRLMGSRISGFNNFRVYQLR